MKKVTVWHEKRGWCVWVEMAEENVKAIYVYTTKRQALNAVEAELEAQSEDEE